jgi:hypothetical protein
MQRFSGKQKDKEKKEEFFDSATVWIWNVSQRCIY